MRIFITGSTGFIGQYLTRQLIQTKRKKDRIFCFVRDPQKLPKDIRSSGTVLCGSGNQISEYAKEIQSCDYIYHIAARSALGNGAAYQKDNVEFTDQLIRIAELNKKLRRFLFVSTIGAVDRTNEDSCSDPLTETSIPDPHTDYGRSKLVSEQRLEASTIPYTIIRPTWVYGPGMRANSHVRVFAESISKGKLLTKCYLPGKVSLIYIHDLVSAIIISSRHPRAKRQIYFVSDGQGIALGELFKMIGEITGRSAGKIDIGMGIPYIMNLFRRYLPFLAQNLFSNVLWASSEKLNKIGWAATVDQRQGLLRTIHWIRTLDNPQILKTACVTGAGGGIGSALCCRLYAEGYNLIITDRDKQRLLELQKLFSAETVSADLSDMMQLRRLARYVEKNAKRITLLINNAGRGKRELFWKDDIQRQYDIIRVNCLAPMSLMRAVLPTFIASLERKTIINISSSAAFQPLAYMSTYASSKAMLSTFSEGVTEELIRETSGNVEILTVCPSGTNTNFQKASGVKRMKNEKLLPPSFVANAIVNEIGKGSKTFIVGTKGKGMDIVSRLLPRGLERRLWGYLMKERR